jgi:hypothetical protein
VNPFSSRALYSIKLNIYNWLQVQRRSPVHHKLPVPRRVADSLQDYAWQRCQHSEFRCLSMHFPHKSEEIDSEGDLKISLDSGQKCNSTFESTHVRITATPSPATAGREQPLTAF